LLISCSSVPKENKKHLDKNLVKNLISNLSWNSIEIITNYGTSLNIVGKEAIELEKLGKQVSLDLLNEFKDYDKSIVIHLILTNIWEPEVNFLKVMYSDLPKSEEVMIEYRVNNFSWYESPGNNSSFSIDTVERGKIYNYWSKRIEEVKLNKN
jgi:hypothetical protein